MESISFYDKCDSEIVPGDLIIYAHNNEKRPSINYAIVLEVKMYKEFIKMPQLKLLENCKRIKNTEYYKFIYDSSVYILTNNKTEASQIKLKILGYPDIHYEPPIKTRPSSISFSKSILKITSNQIPKNILNWLKINSIGRIKKL